MTPFFNFDISLTTIILLSVSALCILFLLTFYRSRVARIAKHQKKCNEAENDSCNISTDDIYHSDSGFDITPSTLPSASVIVYCNDDATNLAQLLPQILEQDYPAPFEVIVVNDGSVESTSDVVNQLEMTYHNLYLTYTPDRSRSLSRKKLALTIGIKAARYEVVVTVNANSRIHSSQWLSLITRNFDESTDVVIGYATPDASTDTYPGRRRRAFDRVAEATTYLSAALGKAPYRGFSYNLAYRRECFFNNKGFSRSLNLHFGDDDVFINEITTSFNTQVELSNDSIIECQFYDPVETHKILKRRYSYTSRYLRKGYRTFFGISSLTFWIWLLTSLTAIIISLPNLFPAAIALILSLILWIPITSTWRGTMNALQSRKLRFSIPWLIMTRPFYNAIYKLNSRRNYRRNHTWLKK